MTNQTCNKDLTSAFCVLAKPIFVAIAWCAMAGSLWGAPFAQWIATKSPRGVPIRIWGQGDEYSAHFETEDGHAVVYDSLIKAYAYARKDATTGALVTTGIAVGDETPGDQAMITGISPHERDTSDAFYAQRKKRIDADESNAETLKRWRNQKATHRQRRRYKRAIDNGEEMPLMAPPSSHTVGQIVGVTLLIDFPTSSDGSGSLAQEVHPDVTKTDLEQLVNGENFSKWGNASSVRKYYEDVSGGNLVYTNIVMGWFKAAHVRSYYDNPDEDNGRTARILIGEILEQIANAPDYETRYLPLLQQVSYSGSYFKALNVFFSGQSAEVWSKGLWAHKSSLTSTYTKLPVKIGSATKYFYNYQISPVTDVPTIGTFCHENGHMICGFPDLYSYKDGGGNGIGAFCLMCSSTSSNPQYICAYLRAAAGWVTPREMPTGVNVLSVSNRLDDVWSFTNLNDDSQYFLIENRKREGRDSCLPGGGILIWRCDENGNSEYSEPLSGFGGMAKYRRNYEVSLEQADGLYELERAENSGHVTDCWYRGNPSSESGLVFSDATEPCAKWKDGSSSGLVMSGFSQNDYVMTFHVGEVVESSYTIDYSLGGGTFGSSHPSGAKQDEVFYVSAPTRGNDTFVGWSVSGLDNPAAKWGTTSNPDTAIANAATRCSNGTSGKVYFKDLALKDGDRVTLIANWRPASPPEESGDWYVSSVWGDDANAGTSWAAPFATLQKAVDSARSAAPTIIVYDGQYEPFEVENVVNLHVRSVNGAERTIIDGSLQWSKGVTNRCATFYMNSQTLTGFTLMNGRQPNGNGGGSYRGIISNCIYRCNSANQGGGAYNGSQYGCRFLDNTATYGGGACFGNRYGCSFNGNHADTGGGSYGGSLNGCLLHGNSAKWGGGSRDGTLINCTLSRNSADYSGGGVYSDTLCNCIVWDNVAKSDANIYSADCSWTCTTPLESGEGNICDNPKFVDALHGDFHLLDDSPCINAGANQYVNQDLDLDGSPRIVAETVDMGAYERQAWTPIENHSVTFDLGEHGTRVGGGELNQAVVHGGAAVAPIITPETGYTFSGWDRVFTNVTSDLTVKAKYSAVSYRIDYFNTRGSANDNPRAYTVEDEVTFAALADLPTLRFAGWEPSRIVRGTTGDLVVTAKWERVQATVDDGSGKTWYVGDTYERTIESPVVNGGTQHVLSAWSVWNVTNFNVIASGTNATIRFEIRNAGPYGVVTEWMTNYWLEVVAPTNGTILGAESGWKPIDESLALLAAPSEGRSLAGWFGDTEGCAVTNGGAILIVPMDRARRIGANFAHNAYTVTFDLGEHGTRVGGGELEQTVAHGGAAVAPTVMADEGWSFDGWDVAFTNVTGDLTVKAEYSAVGYRIEYVNTLGVTNANPCTYTVEDEVTFAALADLPAWRFAGWEPARIARGTTGDHIVIAKWERVEAAVDDGTGKTWYVGDTYERTIESPVVSGGTQLVLSAWSVWNVTNFNVIACGTNATVRFEIENAGPYGVETEWATNYWLEVVAQTNGSIVGTESGWQPAGAELHLTAVPAEGFSFAGWFGETDGCSVTNGGATLAVPMDRARKIGADFAQLIPPLPSEPTTEDVQQALEGVADTRLQECITQPDEYDDFREWACGVKGEGGQDPVGVQTVCESPNAWLSYALDTGKLISVAPTADDLKVEEFKPSETEDQTSVSFDFTVSVERMPVGENAKPTNLAKVFGIEGGQSLFDLSADNVELGIRPPENGKVKLTVRPKGQFENRKQSSFFMRVKMKP